MIEIKQDGNSFGFCVQTESGQVLMTSREVSTLAELESMVDLLKSKKQTRLLFERKTNHTGDFLFNVKNSSSQLIGHSQLYNSEAGMENGINNLKIVLASL